MYNTGFKTRKKNLYTEYSFFKLRLEINLQFQFVLNWQKTKTADYKPICLNYVPKGCTK